MKKNYIAGLVDRTFETDAQVRAKMIEDRKVRFVISSEAKDRHRTVINMKGWNLDNYNNNPIVGYQHNVYGDNMCSAPNPDDVIGSSRVWIEEANGKSILMGEVTFEKAEINPLAEKIFQKILSGTLRAASVGFLEVGKGRTEEQKDENGRVTDSTYFFKGQELVEWSVVNIPSNPEATKKSLRNHTMAGVGFLVRMGLKVSEVRKIANDILDAIEADENPIEEPTGPDPHFNKYSETLNKRKTKKQ